MSRPTRKLWTAGAIALLGLMLWTASAQAAGEPVWKVSSVTTPTNLAAGSTGDQVQVLATNVGGATAKGSPTPITVEAALPGALEPAEVHGFDMYTARAAFNGVGFGGEMQCEALPVLKCSYEGEVLPGDTLVLTITVNVAGGGIPAGAQDQTRAEGGGGARAESTTPVVGNSSPAAYGISPGSFMVAPSTRQAGAHPNITTSFVLNTKTTNETSGNPRDLRFNLPPGLVGNATGIQSCPISEATRFRCPTDTIVGVATATVEEFGFGVTLTIPVYDVAPLPGEPAAFEFTAIIIPVRLDSKVLSNGEYRVQVSASDLTEVATLVSSTVTLWGVPADHNGPGPISFPFEAEEDGVPAIGGPNPTLVRKPLLTNPTQCTTPLEASMETDPWANIGEWKSQTATVGTMEGCENLSFAPSFKMVPDTLQAGEPAGYTFDLHTPQGEEPDGLAPPDLKDVALTLPAGVVVSPSAATNLLACSDAQFGLHSGVPDACPPAAEVGTVEVKTPALPEALKGQVYIGEPECDPCSGSDAQEGRMVRLFLQVLGEGEDGVLVKLEGRGHIDQETGQITTTFENNPQLPFSELKLVLEGGPRAPLANPRVCGPVESALDIRPWSYPATPDAELASGFDVTGPCPGGQFAPSFTAQTTDNQAGAFSPFTLAFGRGDADQYIKGLQAQLPPGLLGVLSKVPLCKEPQAAAGTCGAESLIGHVQALVGPGSDPYLISGGEAFLTEVYKGAPFGLSIVVPAKAGPYTLAGTGGRGTVVVRAAISVDPHTAQITVTSDPLPTKLDDIPLQVRAVNVTVDRAGFMFNPTSCAAQTITGSLSSEQGTQVPVSAPFQAANCAALSFHPKFAASTQGAAAPNHNGASLTVQVGSAGGPPSNPATPAEANIKRVDVQLPKQLPARLKTLQEACPEATFAANPAACPAASDVGTAKANTPVLPVALEGPAYLVSHGGKAFPELILILTGDGVTLQLNGETLITGQITSSKFETVPDAPISSFELKVPESPNSALASPGGNLCGENLVMPTTIEGQNGAVVTQNTAISVTGCTPGVVILKKKVSGKSVVLSVKTMVAGALTVTGKGLKRYSKKLPAGTHQIKLALSKLGRKELRHHKQIKISAALKGATGGSASKTVKLKL